MLHANNSIVRKQLRAVFRILITGPGGMREAHTIIEIKVATIILALCCIVLHCVVLYCIIYIYIYIYTYIYIYIYILYCVALHGVVCAFVMHAAMVATIRINVISDNTCTTTTIAIRISCVQLAKQTITCIALL